MTNLIINSERGRELDGDNKFNIWKIQKSKISVLRKIRKTGKFFISPNQEDLKTKDFPSHLKQEVLKIQKSRKFPSHLKQEVLKVTKQEVLKVGNFPSY